MLTDASPSPCTSPIDVLTDAVQTARDVLAQSHLFRHAEERRRQIRTWSERRLVHEWTKRENPQAVPDDAIPIDSPKPPEVPFVPQLLEWCGIGCAACERGYKAMEEIDPAVLDAALTARSQTSFISLGPLLKEALDVLRGAGEGLYDPRRSNQEPVERMPSLCVRLTVADRELATARAQIVRDLARATAVTSDVSASPTVPAVPPPSKPLKRCVKIAGESIEAAGAAHEDLIPRVGEKPSAAAWEWVREHHYPKNQCPDIDTWRRYLRAYYAAGDSTPTRSTGLSQPAGSMIRASDQARR